MVVFDGFLYLDHSWGNTSVANPLVNSESCHAGVLNWAIWEYGNTAILLVELAQYGKFLYWASFTGHIFSRIAQLSTLAWQLLRFTRKYTLTGRIYYSRLRLNFIVCPNSSRNTDILNYKSSIDLPGRSILEELILRIASTAGKYGKILPNRLSILSQIGFFNAFLA